jgi:hypothetical protein
MGAAVPPFPKPAFAYEYEVDAQIAALRGYEQTKPGRTIPAKATDRILFGTWNIANLGVQERRDKDYRLLAEILSWFDLIASWRSRPSCGRYWAGPAASLPGRWRPPELWTWSAGSTRFPWPG